MAAKWHVLLQEHTITMASGFESWTDYVCYRGNGKWDLRSESSDPMGLEEGEVFKERFSTKGLVEWVVTRDWEDLCEAVSEHRSGHVDPPDGKPRELGPRASNLLGIAVATKVDGCARLLRKWVDGKWPKPKPVPKILSVTGVTGRMISIGIRRAVYSIETTAGPGYLYPPSRDWMAKFVLKDEEAGPFEQSWTIRLSKPLRVQVNAHSQALEQLRRPRRT